LVKKKNYLKEFFKNNSLTIWYGIVDWITTNHTPKIKWTKELEKDRCNSSI